MRIFLTLFASLYCLNTGGGVNVIDPIIINWNGPGGSDCPSNACYELNELGVCSAKETCYQVKCSERGVSIVFKSVKATILDQMNFFT